MLLQEAISNLKIHQQWRLGADIVMIEPKELTESIDIVLSQLPQQETLYTKQQMIDFAEWIFDIDISRLLMTKKSVLFKQYIQSLKQPKKY